MPYVKPTVHLSRIAGTALKSFTHGYAQTVVAASQSSHAAQNTPTGPLYDNLLGRFRRAERSRVSNAHHATDLTRQAGAGALNKNEGGAVDQGLEKYVDAWQKHQKNELQDWHQFQLAKRIEWQPPTTFPSHAEVSGESHDTPVEVVDEPISAPALKRSYTTSALDNFGKAFDNDAVAEAEALERVNNAIAEEVSRSKEDDGFSIRTNSPTHPAIDQPALTSKADTFGQSTSNSSEKDHYTAQLLRLAENRQYAEIPMVFRDMLRSGVEQPSPVAYRALLAAVLDLTRGKHQKVPKALELYSDMIRRKVVPDGETFSTLVQLLAKRAREAQTLRTGLESRRARYGGLHGPDQFLFGSSQSEYNMLLEDSSLSIALKLFDRSLLDASTVLNEEACAALIVACARRGQVEDMARVHQYMLDGDMISNSTTYGAMISAYGVLGDLRSAVDTYDSYKSLALDNNAGKNQFDRDDFQIYASLIMAYGSADRLKGGLKFLSSIQAKISNEDEIARLMDVVSSKALLPLALKEEFLGEGKLETAFDLAESLPASASASALSTIVVAAADRNLPEPSIKAFTLLAAKTSKLAEAATAMLAMYVRNANLDSAEPFWRILESATPTVALLEPTVMRAIALIGSGQAEVAVRQSRRMFARVREHNTETGATEVLEQIDEAIEMLCSYTLSSQGSSPAANVELLQTMAENGGLIAPIAEHIVARFGPEQIARLKPIDVEILTRIQAGMILDDTSADIAGPARFGCLLENITSRSIMPSTQTENLIERTLVNIDRGSLSTLWNNYRYPPSPIVLAPAQFSPATPAQAFNAPAYDDSFDPYASRTDVKGSNIINELVERPQGRRLNEALSKFRNMRRVGRVPRMFTYGKLIEAASKENNVNLANEILQMAKQDVPFDARYRVVRHGWQQILDHMVAGCLTIGRRDLAARYHQELREMGSAPSANTFGLYITTLKENTRTFDEASEAVKIFHRAREEGVEPTSFLYNALIGKLGKARRIDDCLFYFAEMRNLGIRPTSVTYGTIVNALCRVSDEKFAEEIFEEMENCANYKPRPAPYHSLMQHFLTTKRDRSKVLTYYERMRGKGIEPTAHTYKLLIDTHATLEPVDMDAAEAVLANMRASNIAPDAVHYASLIHAKGCVLHDMAGARHMFDTLVSENKVHLQACIYQAMFEALNANHMASQSDVLLADMLKRGIEITPYIANALIHGWTLEKNVAKARATFDKVSMNKREPSTYEAMVRAYLAAEDRDGARAIVHEALSRGYPSAVGNRIAELVR